METHYTIDQAPSLTFTSLSDAMEHAKTMGTFVIIEGNGMQICGKFGADSVEQGRLPSGHEYTYVKRRLAPSEYMTDRPVDKSSGST